MYISMDNKNLNIIIVKIVFLFEVILMNSELMIILVSSQDDDGSHV